LFWGRIPVENAYSLYRYRKGSRFQQLIHDLKYRDRKDIGKELGRLMGIEIKETPFSTAELILPVPLHKTRQRKRGYNQCDPVCAGLSESLHIPYRSDLLERPEVSGTQTDKSRIERWTNVEGIFRVKQTVELRKKHILLVDDVVTTGATLETCASAILNVEGTRVSIATLAVAPKTF
jgi:ComF family protein